MSPHLAPGTPVLLDDLAHGLIAAGIATVEQAERFIVTVMDREQARDEWFAERQRERERERDEQRRQRWRPWA